ncbi:MAG: tetratricopeptide repeat protein [Bacteroidia bacterium]|nr:tetratricopeptide repeat protein [Bacteroidia bacterium]
MNRLKAIFFLIIIFIPLVGISQKTIVVTDKDANYKVGLELFQKEKYGAAQKQFEKTIASHEITSLLRIDAEYYRAICASELFNKDGEFYLKLFVKEHPESPKVKMVYFYLGKYNYRKKKYKEALDWFAKVDIYDLTTEELAEFYFKRGYSYFSDNKFAEAKKDFYEIKDVDTKYASASKYYYAHIAYGEKNYETALTDFNKLKQNETFGGVIPYYIAQIYYLQGKYDSVIAYAPALLDSANTKRAYEIARIVGESYFRKNNFKEAIPFFKRYEKDVKNIGRNDNYQLGYALYKVGSYDDATFYFIKATNVDDSLSENSLYHLGECYLKMNNKENARNAFGQASKLNIDKSINELSLYNYAKLCYELSYNPYNEATKAFQQYLKFYPNSIRVDEAYAYLVNVFTTTKNYKGAIEAIESIKILTPDLKQAYQKVCYYRGVDLFNNMEFNDAILAFNKSMTYKFDKNISALSIYWKAESFYRLKKYTDAIENYLLFIAEPGSIAKSEYSDANYNIGYSYLKLQEYEGSILWFRKFVTFKPQADQKKINDALNRIGDGYFMSRDFANAADYYSQSYKMKLISADYALFQKALAEGVLKKYTTKILDLKTFINSYPKSSYIQRAKFELAYTYQQDGQNELALSHFKSFMSEYPNSTFENTCLSKIGLIYYNKKDDDNALLYFDKLIKRDKNSSDAKEAIGIVQKIYTDKGNVQGLEDYMSSMGVSLSQITLDSIAFNIGKTHYLEQDCKSVVVDFEKYLQKFPNGIFITEANFYKAECDYSIGNIDASLIGYMFVIGKNKNQFTEKSLSRATEIVYKKQDYVKAIELYNQLEQVASSPKNNQMAYLGIMRCNYNLKNYEQAISYASKLTGVENVGVEITNESRNIIAQSYLALQKLDDALAEFRVLAVNSKGNVSAEANYNIAYIYYLKNDYKASEKNIFEFIKAGKGTIYWISKCLILQADNYLAFKNIFQAKATLQGVIEDSEIPELIKIAQEKLDKINAEETAAKVNKTMEEPLKIQFEENSEKQNKLFDESTTIPVGEELKNEQ